MVAPQTPPEVTRPHITDIGMNPQIFSPPVKQEVQSNFASPILPASKGSCRSRKNKVGKPLVAKESFLNGL